MSASTLRRLARQFLEALADGSEVLETSAFRVHFWQTPDPFYRNVAVPVREVAQWRPAVGEMVRLFEARARTPRLEFFAELWPSLPPALEAAGFETDQEATVMIRGRMPPLGTASHPAPVLLGAATPASFLDALFSAAADAFGEPRLRLDAAELARLREGLARGATHVAVAIEDGRPVSSASLIGMGGTAELAGVWTARDRRRRGLATSVCSRLLHDFFARGGELAWLSAADDGGERLYRRLGFMACGTQLNCSLPAVAAASSAA